MQSIRYSIQIEIGLIFSLIGRDTAIKVMKAKRINTYARLIVQGCKYT